MNAEQLTKLNKLADHLIGGKLGHAEFNFWVWNVFPADHNGPRNTCGTSGCAVGECPVVFPDEWEFDETGRPVLIGNVEDCSLTFQAAEFFGLNHAEAIGLFVPQIEKRHRDVSAEEVGGNILRLLRTKEITE